MRIEIEVGEPSVAVHGFDPSGEHRGTVRVKLSEPPIQRSANEWQGERTLTHDSLGTLDNDHILTALRDALHYFKRQVSHE